MSATVDAQKFSNYFDQCIAINIPGHTFPVEVLHLEEILHKTDYAVSSVTENDDLLSAYLKQKDFIDHKLLVHVIKYVHFNTSKDGAILVFLPGYKEIIDQSEHIKDIFDGMHCDDYRLVYLHSNMQEGDAFEHMPSGIRKIILSTNIAETSITIDDVVYVIDVGLVKETAYNTTHCSTCLEATKISKACAKQRTGRAGRTKNGFCYRLYSTEQFQSMADYTSPEIQRIALTEISLKSKMLAPNQAIETFLLQAIDPPPIENLRQSIQLLKEIGALNSNEELTHLGGHLAHMPVDVQLGKVVLYGIFMKCLDPILTVVSAMSIGNPFKLPTDVESRVKINKARKEYAYTALSDHQMLIDIYNEWNSSDNCYQFCRRKGISHISMEAIRSTRTLLKHYINRYTVFESDLNHNSMKFEVVKACIIAGSQRRCFFFNFLF